MISIPKELKIQRLRLSAIQESTLFCQQSFRRDAGKWKSPKRKPN